MKRSTGIKHLKDSNLIWDLAIVGGGATGLGCAIDAASLHIHGYRPNPDLKNHMYVYGSDEPLVLDLIKKNPALGEKLLPKYSYTAAEVVWAVREEMA
ncbi:MAG: glycerol-3-phosphate dehydrogenase C-terminal domain-containing protein [Phocaeicola sp.]